MSETGEQLSVANPSPAYERAITSIKAMRADLDGVLQRAKVTPEHVGALCGRELSLARTKIEEGIMWLGMALKQLNGGVSCYRHGYDSSNATVEPTADGVKL